MIDWNIVVSLLSFIVSAASVFVAYLAIRESKKTTLGTTISGSRQDWINSLRNEIVEFLNIIYIVPGLYHRKQISDGEAIAENRNLLYKVQNIELLINPKEDKHNRLISLLYKSRSMFINCINDLKQNQDDNIDIDQDEFEISETHLREKVKEIVELAQDIFKEEWERVKKGK